MPRNAESCGDADKHVTYKPTANKDPHKPTIAESKLFAFTVTQCIPI
jgi:hypothetical protein